MISRQRQREGDEEEETKRSKVVNLQGQIAKEKKSSRNWGKQNTDEG